MSTPSWQYIAGFFDGEGNISIIGKSKMINASFSQARRPGNVLEEIKKFLLARGVRCRISMHCPEGPRRMLCEQLKVTDWRSNRKLLRKMLPYLIVKRDKALSTLQYIRGKKWNASLIPAERLQAATAAYQSGLSFSKIEQRFKIHSRTLRNFMLKQGIKSRTKSEGIQMYWKKTSKTDRLRRIRSYRKMWVRRRQRYGPSGHPAGYQQRAGRLG